MSFFDLEPSDLNIKETLIDNTLDRNIGIYHFLNLISAFENGGTIAIDDSWGNGKTFFVKQIKKVFDSYNDLIPQDTNEKENIKIIVNRYSRDENFLETFFSKTPFFTIYYDAWENDNDYDPILSLINEIVESLDNIDLKDNEINITELSINILEFFTGKNISNIARVVKPQDLLEGIKNQKKIKTAIKTFFDKLLPEKGEKLLIIIDELDRCKPDYAIMLLERIKHYFNNDRIIFLFAINSESLCHILKEYYGLGYNATRYLDKFFDIKLNLPQYNQKSFYYKIGLDDDLSNINNACYQLIKQYNFSLREITKFYKLVKASTYNITNFNSTLDIQKLLFHYLNPFLIALRMNDIEKYNECIKGLSNEEFKNFFLLEKIKADVQKHIFHRGELSKQEVLSSGQKSMYEKRIEILYNELFNNLYDSKKELIDNNDNKKDLLETINFISYFSNFDNIK